jgi:hypothetical protein
MPVKEDNIACLAYTWHSTNKYLFTVLQLYLFIIVASFIVLFAAGKIHRQQRRWKRTPTPTHGAPTEPKTLHIIYCKHHASTKLKIQIHLIINNNIAKKINETEFGATRASFF